ncbi:MFS transporter superfamily [Arabidopsis suecica]|jgi:solute carrier family 45 protein 1/2/4|uniref:Sucrose transport protein SUC3 n=3 Tax=Arabidopsis TaxID=3701 RepID=SUC3_ARATH|nr:sucrose transporter 2 [Arabidopsis thaliana]O80605.1 RecName: Full=Sucrose transport protein SUC3; Short=AtSUC3; AltName: Full=Sucrose permease 3; AltName: Full=Sucrose transporter 2; AltName: Full=Sucrose-proton symporter 3 [Arabidopsis thaliana]KAG7640327.1 MFS transporter superfamily [Arabidopsis suecica]AAC32907.1 putative sucrose/H+ symporter [Arabidopsis thaliana]AEC05635.1 sucrose transporter 2 [Arabidopsis thaliana]CAB92307.1 sucrose transporter [Arabidopsis thaliana]BAE99038.1 Suc|eukprot:NP_178389.1 sucrose transporter 2 [Arabidopsis thaliana]
MSDSVSISVPYRNLRKEIELETVTKHRQNESGSSSFSESASPSNHSDSADGESVSKNCSLVTLVLSCTVAAGVQFGWALQLSLLTPYIQTLGISHAFSSFIWLCGPITGLVVQPFVGIWSDKCTSKYGRRRPFILVGSFMISIAVIIIGFSADIGYLLGDSKEHCSTFKGTRTRAAVVFIIGFWLLDLANNTVQGPARALLADLSGPDQRNTANAVFCLWMAIGNILGFSAGASGKWQEWFPFLTSRACCAACGNLKAAFLLAVVFLTICTLVTIYFAKEIPFTSNKPTRIQDSAPLLDDLQSKGLEHSKLNNGTANGIKYERVERDTDEQFGNSENEHQDETYVDGPGSVLVNLLTSLRHLPPAMHSVLIVMALTWLSWFPFFLFDTDWMGREVYHGDPTGDSLHMELYDQGVREGALGLLLNSVVLGISSFLIEPMCQRMGARVVWALSNFTVFACMAGTAVISLMSLSDDKNGIEYIMRGNETTRTAAVIVFALLGFPLAITYSVPFSVTAEVTADSGGGQGLAIGVLNLAIVIPQMIVSLGAGPWDQLFGGGNLPAFVLASVAAFAAGVIALQRLPTLSSSFKSTGFHIG